MRGDNSLGNGSRLGKNSTALSRNNKTIPKQSQLQQGTTKGTKQPRRCVYVITNHLIMGNDTRVLLTAPTSQNTLSSCGGRLTTPCADWAPCRAGQQAQNS